MGDQSNILNTSKYEEIIDDSHFVTIPDTGLVLDDENRARANGAYKYKVDAGIKPDERLNGYIRQSYPILEGRSPTKGILNGSSVNDLKGIIHDPKLNSKNIERPAISKALGRVMMQALVDAGCVNTAKTFREECDGVEAEDGRIAILRSQIIYGSSLDEAIETLKCFACKMDSKKYDLAIFKLSKQRYIELIEDGKSKLALEYLQGQLMGLCGGDKAQIGDLARLLVTGSKSKGNLECKRSADRNILLEEVLTLIPTTLVLPSRRLETLLNQARLHQFRVCPMHLIRDENEYGINAEKQEKILQSAVKSSKFNGTTSTGLIDDGYILEDHQCALESFLLDPEPRVLKKHTDQVWHVSFSPNKKLMATGGKDKTVIVWRLSDFEVISVLRDHQAGVTHVAWGPESLYLVTSSLDSRIRLWDVTTGICLRVFVLGGEVICSLLFEDATEIKNEDPSNSNPTQSIDPNEYHRRTGGASWPRRAPIAPGMDHKSLRDYVIIAASSDGMITRFNLLGDGSLQLRMQCRDLSMFSTNDKQDSGVIGENSGEKLIVALDQDGVAHVLEAATLVEKSIFRMGRHPNSSITSILCGNSGILSTWLTWRTEESRSGRGKISTKEPQGWVAWHEFPKEVLKSASLGDLEPATVFVGHVNRRFLLRAALGGGLKEDLVCIGSEGKFLISF